MLFRSTLIGRLIVAGDYDSDLLSSFNTITSATGASLQVGRFGEFLTVDAGRIIDEDVEGDNGRLYALDAVPEIPLSPIASLERSGHVSRPVYGQLGEALDVDAERRVLAHLAVLEQQRGGEGDEAAHDHRAGRDEHEEHRAEGSLARLESRRMLPQRTGQQRPEREPAAAARQPTTFAAKEGEYRLGCNPCPPPNAAREFI